jgi:hypothetical protein
MANRSNMSQDDFDRLLQWFGPDRGMSGKKYLETHEKLTRLFHFNGCNRPEDLADEVMNRVAKKPPSLENPNSDHIAVLLGFGRNVLHEYWRERARFDEARDLREEPSGMDESTLKELQAQCLDGCLEQLGEDAKYLLLEYHEYEPGEKIRHRKAMAEARHMTLNALRLRACRWKSVLADCVRSCFHSSGATRVQ